MKDTVLVVGACGQIGPELVVGLRQIFGNDKVIASDIKPANTPDLLSGPFEVLDIMNEPLLFDLIKKYKVTQVYLLASGVSQEKLIRQASIGFARWLLPARRLYS